MNDIIMQMNSDNEKKYFDIFFDDWAPHNTTIAIDFDSVRIRRVSFNYYEDTIEAIFDVKDDADSDYTWGFGMTYPLSEYNRRQLQSLMATQGKRGVAFVKLGGSRMIVFHAANKSQ